MKRCEAAGEGDEGFGGRGGERQGRVLPWLTQYGPGVEHLLDLVSGTKHYL